MGVKHREWLGGGDLHVRADHQRQGTPKPSSFASYFLIYCLSFKFCSEMVAEVMHVLLLFVEHFAQSLILFPSSR